jgi:electron transport complex protein RnfB
MIGMFIMLLLSGLLTVGLYLFAKRPAATARDDTLQQSIDVVDSLLPQTQCGKCHYPGCRPYAEAIARGEADINQCPPGGAQTMQAIARLLGRDTRLDFDEQGLGAQIALIDGDLCIGCVKCIGACPVDAIIGAPKKMHTVIKQNCTGCGLCIAPCPVDCISLVPVRVKTREWVWAKPDPALRLRG